MCVHDRNRGSCTNAYGGRGQGLAQMLIDAGLKLGQFDAYTGGKNHGFGQQNKHQEQNGELRARARK